MNRIVKRLLSVILILGMVLAPLCEATTAYASEEESNPMRAVWLRPKEWTKEQVEQNVQKLADTGINTIFLETVYEGFTIFPVEYDYISQHPIYQEFDVLQAYIDACHSRGMQLHCWVESFFIGLQTNRGGGPVYKALKGTDWLLTDKEGNAWEETMYGKMYFLNPARPDCREWIVGLYEIIVKNYDIDGIQLDYVRYPEKTAGKDYGYDDYTAEAFMKWREDQGEEVFDPREVKSSSFEAGVYDYYKQLQVTEYVKMCSDRLRAANPDLLLSLSVYPFFSEGPKKFMQSAELWMKEGYGDFVASMAYYENQVKSIASNTVRVAGDSPMNAVVGISTQNGFTVESVERQTKEALESGAGVAFFEYETFYNKGYASSLENTSLKDTKFNIDVDTYRTDVERDDVIDADEPVNVGEIILYVVLGVAVLAIIGEVIYLVISSKKKKRDSE